MFNKLFNKLFPKSPPKEAMNLGRNELCWCGSGRKYKQCHYKSDHESDQKAFNAKCKDVA